MIDRRSHTVTLALGGPLALSGCGASPAPARTGVVVEIVVPAAPTSNPSPEPAAEPASLADYAGSYAGELMELGEMVPVTTELFTDGDRLLGRYTFGHTEEDEGFLTDCRVVKPHFVSCTWTDVYGTGSLVMRFDALRLGFDGAWAAADNPEELAPWNGQRQDTSL